MNLVTFWEAQVAKWNTEQKCGMCWAFGAPLTDSAAESQEIRAGEECCVQVWLLNTSFNTQRQYYDTGLYKAVCNKSFQLLVLIPTSISINNWNETKGHSTDESKWTTALSLIQDCLACDAELDFCDILANEGSRITQWNAVQVINYRDGYSGYKLSVTFSNPI